MTVDALAFLPPAATPDEPSPLSGLLAEMSRLGLGRTILCTGAIGRDEVAGNAAVAAAVAEHPLELAALVRLSPRMPDWQAELGCYGERAGFVGALLHPWEDRFEVLDPATRSIVEAVSLLELPLVVGSGHPWVGEPLQIGALARDFPSTPFVLTNEGQLNISGMGATDVSLLLASSDNVFLHTTGAYREDFLQSLIARFGPQRLMFASQSPRFSRELELRRVEWMAGVSPAAIDVILEDAARRVFRRL